MPKFVICGFGLVDECLEQSATSNASNTVVIGNVKNLIEVNAGSYQ